MNASDDRILGLLQEARRSLETDRMRRSESLAIVGIGCRFPGGASSPASLWALLREGRDATTEIPPDRWDSEAYFDPDPAAPGKCYVQRGGFLDAVDGFEPEFFGISPREAVAMDPQQRLLLEVAWEALEDAGIPPSMLRGSATGVWVGSSLDDYATLSLSRADLREIDGHSALGTARSVAAGRIAYRLDLHGPVLQVDASCASSLLAVHLACQSLRSRECDRAIVGGVSVMSSPASMIALSKLRALARDGRCKTFDASADGYGRGEGCGVIVLERQSDAEASGRRIRALVRGSAVNHDGQSNGLTAPNGKSQEAVLESALANAGVEPSAVDYVEAHGTGTLLGDPVELVALGRVYGRGRGEDSPLLVGSIKTNFGHLEGAAGIAGLIKAVLCVEHGRVPPHLHFRRPNPNVRWDALPIRVPTEESAWARSPRVAGVSSFGMSGTNVHVVVGQHAHRPVSEPLDSARERVSHLVCLSAETPGALREAARRLEEHLREVPEAPLGDVAYGLATRRALFAERAVLVASSREALRLQLTAIARGESVAGAIVARAEPLGKLAWVFAGQGSQRPGMGRALYQQWAPFRSAFDEALDACDRFVDVPLRDILWAAPGSALAARVHRTAYAQPALFAIGWALGALFRAWGLEPGLLVGHSLGEITAACFADVFSLEDAAKLVCARGALMQALEPGGAMVAVAASEAEVEEAIGRTSGVVLAAVNAPSSVVVSGEEAQVLALAERFAARGAAIKRLTVSHAFHSPKIDPMLGSLRSIASSLTLRPPAKMLVSTLSGRLAGAEVAEPEYWVRQARYTVRFAEAVRTVREGGGATFLELSPRVTLAPLVRACAPDRGAPLVLNPGSRPSDGDDDPLVALATWAGHGGSFDVPEVFARADGTKSRPPWIDLPTYSWQRSRYWLGDGAAPRSSEGAPGDGAARRTERIGASPAGPSARLDVRAIQQEVARVLGARDVATISIDEPLVQLGLDSVLALELESALRRQVSASLPPDLALPTRCVRQIAAHLEQVSRVEGALATAPAETLVGRAASLAPACVDEVLEPVARRRAVLFCFHGAGATSATFAPLRGLAAEGIEVHVLSRDRRTPPSTRHAEDFLGDVVGTIRGVGGPPFALFGHSVGSLLAYRTALELVALGGPRPTFLAVSSAPPPPARRELPSTERLDAIFRAALGVDPAAHPRLREDFGADLLFAASLPPRAARPIDVPLLAFRGADDPVVGEDEVRAWQARTASSFSFSALPGSHAVLAQEGARASILSRLAERLLA